MRSSAIPAPLDTMRDGAYGPLLAATTINAVRRREGALAALLGLPLPAPTCPVTFTQAGWALRVPSSSCIASFGLVGEFRTSHTLASDLACCPRCHAVRQRTQGWQLAGLPRFGTRPLGQSEHAQAAGAKLHSPARFLLCL